MRKVTLPPTVLQGLPPPPDAPTLTDTAAAPDPGAQVRVGPAAPYTAEYDPSTDLDAEARRRVLMAVPAPGSNDPMQDPGFRSFIAKRAQDLAELKAAQQQAADTRGSTGFQVGNMLVGFGAGLQGRSGADLLHARDEAAGRPVADVLQRQEAERAGTKGALEETGLAGEVFKAHQAGAAADPASAMSRAQSMLALHQGLIKQEDVPIFAASMVDSLHKGASIQAAREEAQARIAQAGAALAETRSRHNEQARHEMRMEDILAARFGPGARGKPLPAMVEQRLQAGIGGITANEALRQAHHAAGIGDPFSYGQELDALSPEIAAAKSPTGKESPLMVKQMHDAAPSRFTPNDLADKYFDATHKTFTDRLQTAIASYKREGYDVAGLEMQLAEALKGKPTTARVAAPAAPAKTPAGGGPAAHPLPTETPIRPPSDQDLAAVDWLMKNPQDPAAEGVRARLKAKGIQ